MCGVYVVYEWRECVWNSALTVWSASSRYICVVSVLRVVCFLCVCGGVRARCLSVWCVCGACVEYVWCFCHGCVVCVVIVWCM